MDLEQIGINAGNQVDSAQDRNYWRALVNEALSLRVLQAMDLVSLNTMEFIKYMRYFNGPNLIDLKIVIVLLVVHFKSKGVVIHVSSSKGERPRFTDGVLVGSHMNL